MKRISSNCRLAEITAGFSIAPAVCAAIPLFFGSCVLSFSRPEVFPTICFCAASRFCSVSGSPSDTALSTASSVICSNRSVYSTAFSRLLLSSARFAPPAAFPSAMADAIAERICFSSCGSVRESSWLNFLTASDVNGIPFSISHFASSIVSSLTSRPAF